MNDFQPLSVDQGTLAHTAILASAGSGKTFQLVNRFLRLLAAGAAPSSILASTFTRLAAGQIRDRVLQALAEAAQDGAKRRDLGTHLGLRSFSGADAAALLRRMIDSLHATQIRTLDSFFASIVRCFAIELGLPPDARVVDEVAAASLRQEAVRLMLDEHDPQRLVDLLRLLTQGGADRGVVESIDHVVTMLSAIGREACDDAWACVPERPGRMGPAELADAISAIESLEIPLDRKSLLKAWTQDIERMHHRDWIGMLKHGIGCAVLKGNDSYARVPLSPDIVAAYSPLMQHIVADFVHRAREQTLATRELLGLFRARHDEVKRNAKAMTFDDLVTAVARARDLEAFDDIGFRLDASLHHLLLDEFQDTSLLQWQALEPLVAEALSQVAPERTFFCVGDVKQSIYGWRSAAPEILQSLPARWPAVTTQRLSRSYRSSPVIMSAVNQVFGSLRGNAAVGEWPASVDAWLTGFDRHDTARTERAGYVELRTAPQASGSGEKSRVRLLSAAKLVAELHRERPDLSIAVLTRTNDAVARMFYELGPNRLGIAASGRGGGPLTDAPAVNAVLDLLHLADHPDDTVAAFHVAKSPLGEIAGLTNHEEAAERHAVARSVRRGLLHEGYRACLSRWMARLAPQADAREARRLLQLVELGGRHDQAPTLRTGDFIRMVESTRVPDVQPAAVQVMTIHQSKGLEFDVVVLPDLDAPLIGRTPEVVFERAPSVGGRPGPISRICRSIRKEVRELVPELEPLFAAHADRAVRESLSVLYVAMTRAMHALHVIIDPASPNEKKVRATLAGVVRLALCDGDATAPDSLLHQSGDARWAGTRPRIGNVHAPMADVGRIELAAPLPDAIALADRGVTAAAASAHEAREHGSRETVRPPQPLLPRRDARDRGAAIHALFEQVEWLEELGLDDVAMAELLAARLPRRDAAWRMARVAEFRAMLGQAEVAAALTRPAKAVTCVELHRELPFARLVGGRVQTGFIDRLELLGSADGSGAITAARVVDYKTDDLAALQSPGRLTQYGAQLTAYREVVCEMFGLPVSAVRMTLLAVSAGRAIDIQPDQPSSEALMASSRSA